MADVTEVKYSEDMDIHEVEALKEYISNGCPGIVKVTDSDIFKWFELYMSGKTYSEIAKITGAGKDKILYISHKARWCDRRMEYFKDLISNMSQKMAQVKLKSANTMATIVTALGKYYGKKFDKYLANNDEAIISNLDTKLLAQYYKSMDTLDKLTSLGRKPSENDDDQSNPSVNINMYGNTTIKKSDETTLEITDENAGDFLKALASAKKEKDSEET